jgi:hypothetical protein
MQREVLQFLQSAPGQLFSVKEVGKRVCRKSFQEDPQWAKPALNSLRDVGLIDRNQDGYYFFPKPALDF